MKVFKLVYLFALLGICNAQSQEFLDPVTWEVKVAPVQNNQYNIIMEATIDSGWHLYSQTQFGDEFEGPIRTEFYYNDSDSTFALVGQTVEPEVASVFDPVFELDVIYFEDRVRFEQLIEVSNPEDLQITAEVYYSVCDAEKCLPPDTKSFTMDLTSGQAQVVQEELTEDDLIKSQALSLDLKGGAQFQADEQEETGLMSLFFLGFIGGLLALLTPCVFPMIPLTVSFFTKGAQNKAKGTINALLYGTFIF